MDTNAQDLEEANRKLRNQSQSDKETMAALTSSLETAESRIESLEAQLNSLRNEKKEKEESDVVEMAKQVKNRAPSLSLEWFILKKLFWFFR